MQLMAARDLHNQTELEGQRWLELQLRSWCPASNNRPRRKAPIGNANTEELQMTCDFTPHQAPTSISQFDVKSFTVRAPQCTDLTITIKSNFRNARAGQIRLLRRLMAPFLNANSASVNMSRKLWDYGYVGHVIVCVTTPKGRYRFYVYWLGS